MFFVIHGAERLGERIARTDDGNVHGFALAAVDNANNVFVAGNVFAVDFKNRIVQKDSGLLRSGTCHRREAHHHAVPGIDTDIADTHLDFGTGGILRGNHKFFGNNRQGQRFAATMYRQGNFGPKAHANLFAEIVPTLGGLAVDFGDGIARDNASHSSRRILAHKTHDEFICRWFLHTHHVKQHQQDKRKSNVDERARKSNRRARAHGLGHKIALVGKFAILDFVRVFAQIIKRAYLNPSEHFYLVIEEINRGNAAAIFGNAFQLLDRLKEGETDSLGNDPANPNVNRFTKGWSQYFIQNDDINEYVRKAIQVEFGKYEESKDTLLDEILIGDIRFNANTAIRIPPNLSILATMNTSDQNVFTLDNAFQRRFDMQLVRNEFEKGNVGGFKTKEIKAQHDAEIADTDISWGKFWHWINTKITQTLKGLTSTEDKRIGVWFVSNHNGKIGEKVFAEKVLKYLWDDIFKFKRPQVFADGIDTLEKLIEHFEKSTKVSRFDVFRDKTGLVNDTL